ncbi:MAG: hypothetical protein CL569_02535 [Alphaproteobacteria bacterium]|nr:hypothetical protein [Alphaproteobacteria bacterium]|tara:strand:- start:12156 stop:12362 length:207 start_codon:yes stop_codon:yes gene_type:complete
MLEIVAPEGVTPSHIRDLLVEAGYQEVSEAKEAFNGPGSSVPGTSGVSRCSMTVSGTATLAATACACP